MTTPRNKRRIVRDTIRALAEKIAYNEHCWGPEPGDGYNFFLRADEKDQVRGVQWDAFKGEHPWHQPGQIEAHLLSLLEGE